MLEINELVIIPLISVILYTFILVIISTSNKTRLSIAFRYYIIAMIVWSMGSLLMKTNIGPSPIFWNQFFLQTGFFMVPVFLLHFSYVLIRKTGRNTVLRLSLVVSVVIVILCWTGNLVEYAEVVDGDFKYHLYEPQVYIFGGIASAISILAFFTMIKAVRIGELKLKQAQLVIIALALVVLGGASNINETLGELGFDIILNTFSAILITYSIYRNKFLEINLVVKKGLYFSIYNFSLFAIYASGIIVSYNYLIERVNASTMIILLIMSPIFLFLEPIRRVLQRWTDNLFYRANTDRQIILNDFSSLVNTTFSLDKINSSLLGAIHYGINSRDISILLKNSNKYKLHETTIETLNYKDTFIMFSHPIIEWLSSHDILLRNDIDNNILFKRLWDSEKKVIASMNTEMIVPIHYLGEIIGLVVISGREDELPYSEVEVQFLKTLLNNAAAIIENAKTIEMLKLQSITDELTKLHNHRYFHETINQSIHERR